MNDPRNQPDDDLRTLFADATAGVRPQGSLDDILERTKKVDPMARRWFLPVVAAAAVIGLAIGGAVLISHDANSSRGGNGPAGTPTVDPTQSDAGVRASVPVYFVGHAAQGLRLYREFQQQVICHAPDCLVLASARSAVAGTPEDPDYRNPWPDDTTVMSADYDGSVLTLDLHIPWPEATGNGPHVSADEQLAVQQLVFSAQAGLGKGRVPVQLLVDDAKVPMILGVPTKAPILAASEGDILAPVQISSLANGAAVPAGRLTVRGLAATFEANVVWELKAGGTVVQHGHTTARECCTLSPYEFTVTDLNPGTYTLVVHDEDMSGEGRAVNQDTKVFVAQ